MNQIKNSDKRVENETSRFRQKLIGNLKQNLTNIELLFWNNNSLLYRVL